MFYLITTIQKILFHISDFSNFVPNLKSFKCAPHLSVWQISDYCILEKKISPQFWIFILYLYCRYNFSKFWYICITGWIFHFLFFYISYEFVPESGIFCTVILKNLRTESPKCFFFNLCPALVYCCCNGNTVHIKYFSNNNFLSRLQ